MVSVIIPSYNYGRYIGDTIRSVQQQTYTDWECLIIDNGSTDNTAEVVQSFLSDGRLRYISQENLGVSAGRNRGLKEAKGKYIQFLDADDLLQKNKLKVAVEFLDAHSDTHLVYSDMRYFRDDKPGDLFYGFATDKAHDHPWMGYFSGKGKALVEEFLHGNRMVISSPVFRKNLTIEIGLFDETIQYNEDWDFWLRLALAGKTFKYLEGEECMTLIRVHPASASNKVFNMQICGLLVLLQHRTKISEIQLDNLLKLRIDSHRREILKNLSASTDDSFREKVMEIRNRDLQKDIFKPDFISALFPRVVLRGIRLKA